MERLLVLCGLCCLVGASQTDPMAAAGRRRPASFGGISPLTPPVKETITLQTLQSQMQTLQSTLDEVYGKVNRLSKFFLKSSCDEVLEKKQLQLVTPTGTSKKVMCDADSLGNLGWTVVLQRQNGTVDFNRSYETYVAGFGDPATDLWIGLETLHEITSGAPHQLKIELESFDKRTAHATYNTFRIGNSSTNYQLLVGDYLDTSTAADSLRHHNLMGFTARGHDSDHHNENCALLFGNGGGWWYNSCYRVLGTGKYRLPARILPNGKVIQTSEYGGITWHPFVSDKESMKVFKMLIKRLAN